MTRALTVALAALALSTQSGCMASLSLRVLVPAPVTVSPEVQTIGFVDRSRAANVGEGVLGALEGLVTGEAIGSDYEGRDAVRQGFLDRVVQSPRYQVVYLNPSAETAESSLLTDSRLSWRGAEALCRQQGCQGIVALESFDSDATTTTDTEVNEREEDGRTVKETLHIAVRRTHVVTAFRFYDLMHRRVVDDVRDYDWTHSWEQRASTLDEAIANLPSQVASVRHVGAIAGARYAERIAPMYRNVTRTFYPAHKKVAEMRLARDHAKAGNWRSAVDLWLPLTEQTEDSKLRGKAAHNLGIAAEVNGDLGTAEQWAEQAVRWFPNNTNANYLSTVRNRIAQARKLQDQMAQP